MSEVEVSTTVKADPVTVWRLVSDLPRMGEWSPENTGGRWLDGATGPAKGARFRGTNKHGLLRWSTTVTVTAADEGREFAFEVSSGPLSVATWRYTLEATGDTTTVTESWSDRRPRWMKIGSIPVMGVADRAGHNRRNMEATLAALKTTAEQTAKSA